MIILKYLVLSLFFSNYLYSCGICVDSIAKGEVDVVIEMKNDKTYFDIKWRFHKEFVSTLTQYDLNDNGIFEDNEKNSIELSLVNYMEKVNYLIDINFIHKDKEFALSKAEKIEPNYSKLVFDSKGMIYEFKFELDIKLQDDHKLHIGFFDEGNYFQFKIKDIVIKNYKKIKSIKLKEFYAYIYFYENINKEVSILKKSPEQDGFMEFLSSSLEKTKNSLKEILQDIKTNNTPSGYFWLLLFSFVYGVIHAIGPGHGKSLVSSYFLNQNCSYTKAFNISLLIGVVHTFSAFFLTLSIYYILNSLFTNISSVEQMATKISAFIIIFIALYLLYKKLAKKQNSKQFFVSKKQSMLKTPQNNTSNFSCGCNSCTVNSTDLGVILAAGIVPCPGTVTIFIFTMSLNIYYVGFISAVFMSLGMSFIIFLTALLSIKVKTKLTKNKTIILLLEYGSLFFILSLGLILLFL